MRVIIEMIKSFKKTLIFLPFSILITVSAYCQSAERLVAWPPFPQGNNSVKGEDGRAIPSDIKALEIIEVKVMRQPITIGQTFTAEGDWLKSLTLRVKNISGKPIRSIRVLFTLPEAKYNGGSMGFSLEYGKELSSGFGYGGPKTIMPEEEVELARNEQRYSLEQKGIAKRTGRADFRKVLISNMVVLFEDGMVWMGRSIPVRDGHSIVR